MNKRNKEVAYDGFFQSKIWKRQSHQKALKTQIINDNLWNGKLLIIN